MTNLDPVAVLQGYTNAAQAGAAWGVKLFLAGMALLLVGMVVRAVIAVKEG